jgi:hypothetical protein
MERFIIPLYDNEIGGPPRAYECPECQAVCRTRVGILSHRRIVEKKEEQTKFFQNNQESEQQ